LYIRGTERRVPRFRPRLLDVTFITVELQNVTADKTSVESRGSKKSKRIRGLSPNADIPEDTEEAQEEAQEETLSTALAAVLDDP